MILSACFCAFALQTPAPPASGGVRVVVTREGSFLRPESLSVRGNAPAPMQSAGTIWTHEDGGLAWVGNALAIGNHGSEVLAEYDMNSERAELFSVFDTNPPTAIWSDLSVVGSEFHHVASAESSNVHVVLRVLNRGLPNASYKLSKYTSLSNGTPDWSYTFPIGFPIVDDHANVGISRDGQTIVAAASDPASSTVAVAVFGPGSNVPRSYTNVALGGVANRLRGFDLSADGSTLYLSAAWSPVQAYVFDVAAHAVVFSTPLNASYDGHAISGDGSVFAYGSYGALRLFEKVAGVYTNTYTRYLPGSSFCGAIDISDDGSTLACGWSFDDFYLTTRIEALDIPTHNLTMGEVVTATGVLQNIVSEVSVSADGERFAVGLWGDGTGPVAEARLYSKRLDTPLVTLDLDGSVFGARISADGQRAVFGSKQVHANQFGNGGRIDLVGGNTPFENFCFGDGSLATACPCGNSGLVGRGCDNSAGTGGALLTGSGRVAPDSVVLTSSNELAHAPSIFLQGTSESSAGIVFGDGLRCVSGTLKRLYTRPAVDGTVVAPGPGEPSISARSAALGDPLAPGQTRRYQVYYRDPVQGFCPAPGGDTWNVSNAVRIAW